MAKKKAKGANGINRPRKPKVPKKVTTTTVSSKKRVVTLGKGRGLGFQAEGHRHIAAQDLRSAKFYLQKATSAPTCKSKYGFLLSATGALASARTHLYAARLSPGGGSGLKTLSERLARLHGDFKDRCVG